MLHFEHPYRTVVYLQVWLAPNGHVTEWCAHSEFMLFTWDNPHISPLVIGGIRLELLISSALVFFLQPRPSVDLRACAYLPAWLSLLHSTHNGITLLWSCCSLTHDHTHPWMGISAGFSKLNICASQHCHCSNHSLNQNTKSNFTWMPSAWIFDYGWE